MSETKDLTRNQQIVYTALNTSEVPLSAYDILGVDDVREGGLKAPLTIYRALDKLQELGLVHRIESLNAFVACDCGPHTHPVGFMSCKDCKKTIELPVSDCEDLLRAAADAKGFKLDKITVELSGSCTECADGD